MGSQGEIQTFVFLDTEATGLQESRPRITELSLVSAHRQDLQLVAQGNTLPRILNKLTLCFYPMKPISPSSSDITGLYNEALLHHKDLDAEAVDMLQLFLTRLDPPVCLVAHNGFGYDYPLLVTELSRVGRTLPNSLLCTDSLLAVRDLDGVPMYPYGRPRYSPSPIRSIREHSSLTSSTDTGARSAQTALPEKQPEPAMTPTTATRYVKAETPLIKCAEENNNSKNPLTSTPKLSAKDVMKSADVSPVLSAREDDSGIASGYLTTTESDICALMVTPEHQSTSLKESDEMPLQSGDKAEVAQSMESQGFKLSDSDQGSLEAEESSSLSPEAVVDDSGGGDALFIPPVGPAVCSFQEHERTPRLKKPSQTDDFQACLLEADPQEIRSVKRKLFPDDSGVVMKKSTNVDGSERSGKESLGVAPLAPSESSCVSLAHWIQDAVSSEPGSSSNTGDVSQPADVEQCSDVKTPAKTTSLCDLWKSHEGEDSISDEDMLLCTSPLVSSAPSTPGNEMQALEAKLRCSSSSISSNGSSGPGSAEKASPRTMVDSGLELSTSLNASRSSVVSSSTLETPKPYSASAQQTQVNATPQRLRVSYKLEDVHRRVCGFPPSASHCAEDDCISLLRICHRMAPRILPWMDQLAVPFSQNPCMYEVKKVSYLLPGQFPYKL